MKFAVSPTSGSPGTVVTLVATGCNDPSGDSHGFGYNAVGDRQLDTMMQQRFYPNTSWAIQGRLVGRTMRATFRIPADAPRPVGSFNAQCSDTNLDAHFRVLGQVKTLLGNIVQSTRIHGGFKLALAPAKFSEGQYLRIPGRSTMTYDVPSSLVPDPAVLVGAVEVTTRGSTVVNLAIMGG
jgi:hypothetical protein